MTPLSKTIMKLLLSKGYFPKELPPVFTTTDFGVHSESILADWAACRALYTIKKTNDFAKVDGKILKGRYGYKKLGPVST